MATSLANLLVHLHEPSWVKVRLPLGSGVQERETESVWAEPLDGGRYRLTGVPFRASGVARGDVFQATLADDGQPLLQGVLVRGGHTTYRLWLASDEAFARYWPALEALGCFGDASRWGGVALDVPPDADAETLLALLDEGAADGVWQFEWVP